MVDKIKIANYLLTRKCNLSCDYCRICLSNLHDWPLRPSKYPTKKYFIENEKDGYYWNNLSDLLLLHNPDIFIILYGGEIFLHPDHISIINHLNDINANYTIITSANPEIQPLILKMFEEVGPVKGFTCSIDPGFYLCKSTDKKEIDNDELYKSCTGFKFLKYLIEKGLVLDPVAEITADDKNIFLLEDTVKLLSENGITSSITCLDNSHNNNYDFSNIDNPKCVPRKHKTIREIFDKLKASDYKIHMKDTILDTLYEALPSQYNCKLEQDIHNITIDSDGLLRLCLRIRGYRCKYLAVDMFNVEDGSLSEYFKEDIYNAMVADKYSYCTGCNWTCPMMSKIGGKGIINHG